MIIQKTHPITVKGVSDQKVVNHYVNLPLCILESNKTMVIMHIKAYVTMSIQVSVLLDINKLNKEKDNIALWLGRKIMQIDDNKISVLILFTLSGHMSVSFYAYTDQLIISNYSPIKLIKSCEYTEFNSVQLNTYLHTKLKNSRGENMIYSHTKLYQPSTQDAPFKSAKYAIHKLYSCP